MAKQKKALQAVPKSATETSARYPDVYEEISPGALSRYELANDGSCLTLYGEQSAQLRIAAVREGVLRVRFAPEGRFERDFSYAVQQGAQEGGWELDINEQQSRLSLQHGNLLCHISKADCRLTFEDAATGQIINEDAAPVAARKTILNGFEKMTVTKAAQPGEAFFGLGDKSCSLNLRGQRLENWNTDSFGYQKQTDPLYRSIPFYYGLHNGQAYGIFFHNTARSFFDFSHTTEGKTSFWATAGEVDYYFIQGPALLDVARRYAALTGTHELPPIWALGFHQCRWSYYPEERVHELAREFRERRIPCDAIYLDIDYMDGYRCFTWNKAYFPDPAGMIRKLREQGFQAIVMIDPGIKADPGYHVYDKGLEKDVFCYRTSGEVMRGPVWPPECVFPDYTRPDVREWWGQLYEELYNTEGVSGFWNDMNEPAVFQVDIATFPDEVLHDYDGMRTNHRRAHNIYGQQMSRATVEGLKKLNPGKRPFLLTRATFSGGQRYASVWTGDNVASWEHLRLANIQCQRLSISGFSFVGTDVGGFCEQPSGELFARWMQLAVFHPLFRVHSMGNNVDGAAEADAEEIKAAERDNRMDQEPWAFGQPYTDQARTAVELRYKLLPYLYTAFWQHVQDGTPILRSLVFEAPGDAKAAERENEFLFGGDLLVVPVLRPGAKTVTAYLPEGEWLDYETGRKYTGARTARLSCSPDRLPLLCRAGAVVPNYPVQQYTGEKVFDEITLRVYAGSGQAKLYEDAGEGYAHKDGNYALQHFTTSANKGTLVLDRTKEGHFKTSYDSFEIRFYGLSFQPKTVLCDGQPLEIHAENGCFWAKAPAEFSQIKLS